MKDFTEEEYEAEKKIIDKMSINPKPSLYDCYDSYDYYSGAIGELNENHKLAVCTQIVSSFSKLNRDFNNALDIVNAYLDGDYKSMLMHFKKMDKVFREAIEILEQRLRDNKNE